MRRAAGALALLAVIGSASRAPAQAPAHLPPGHAVPSGPPTVSVVTFGLGHEVFERFGHNALWFHDPASGTDVAYHWGLFDFNEPDFLVRFLTGDTRYSMGGVDAGLLIQSERQRGRTITVQRLRLTPEQVAALRSAVQRNALPENSHYRYDYFRDNCSTRLRDALDQVLGGRLRAMTDSVITPLTYRSESVRLTDGDRPAQLGIDVALGRPADVPLTRWQSFFIPMRLRDALRELRVPAESGAEAPLVADERPVKPPVGIPVEPELREVPNRIPRDLAAGLVLAALVVGLRVMSVTRRGAAWGLAVLGSLWWLVCGVVGVLIVLAWTLTQHVFWAANEHLLLLSPLCLALAVLTPVAILRRRALDVTRLLAALVAVLSLIGLLLAVIPGGQHSGAVVALFLPVHLALAWALGLTLPARRRAAA